MCSISTGKISMFGIFVVFEALNLKRLRKLPIIDDHKLPENNIQITEERGRILYPIICAPRRVSSSVHASSSSVLTNEEIYISNISTIYIHQCRKYHAIPIHTTSTILDINNCFIFEENVSIYWKEIFSIVRRIKCF